MIAHPLATQIREALAVVERERGTSRWYSYERALALVQAVPMPVRRVMAARLSGTACAANGGLNPVGTLASMVSLDRFIEHAIAASAEVAS